MMYWQDNNPSGWGIAVMIISMVLFWALIVGGIALAVRYMRRDPTPLVHRRTSAEDLLAERYARGDIDDDDYHTRLTTLRKHAPH